MSTDEDELPFRWSLFLPAPGDAPGMRVMKYAVIGMGVVLILGFMVIFARIVYLTSRMEASPPAAGKARLAIPKGARIDSMALDGNRIALQLTEPGSADRAIAIYDLATGRLISRIALDIESGPPGNATPGTAGQSSAPAASPQTRDDAPSRTPAPNGADAPR